MSEERRGWKLVAWIHSLMESWEPILSDTDALAEGANKALDLIEGTLEHHSFGEGIFKTTISLADGVAGLALFFYYLDQARPDQGHDEKALGMLESAILATGVMSALPGLYDGFSGVAWVLEHLTDRLIEPAQGGGPDPGAEVEAALSSHLSHSPWASHYDLVTGLVGIGVWALERQERTGGIDSLRSIVDHLQSLALRTDEGITWWTPPGRMMPSDAKAHPNGYFDLGVAHGVAGVIGFLAEVEATGCAPLGTRELLEDAVQWLLAQRQAPETGSLFPYIVAQGKRPTAARLAWCYGDLGIAVVLLNAARAANRPDWAHEALAIARATTTRPREDSGVVDGGLCHGAAGLAHLYNRLFHATEEPQFRTEALGWIERLLAMHREEGGWSAWRPGGHGGPDNPEPGWCPEIGFLTGQAGIGLGLLGALTPIEPIWDSVLLCRVPPGSQRQLQLH